MVVRIGQQRDVSQIGSEELVKPFEFHGSITIRPIQPPKEAIIRIPEGLCAYHLIKLEALC